MKRSTVKMNDCTFEILEDDKIFSVISLTQYGVSFCICHDDEKEARHAIFASDIQAWNRKTGIDCRKEQRA